MNLQQELNALSEELSGKAPPEAGKAFANLLDGLKKSGITSKGPQVGDNVNDFSLDNIYHGREVGEQIKDFSLPNPWGESISLSGLLEHGPVVLNFYRGNWCPYCNVELRALQLAVPRFKAHGANLVAISLEKPDESLKTLERVNMSFIVLSDIEGRVARQFKILYQAPEYDRVVSKALQGLDMAQHNGSDVANYVIPATYIIDQDSTIRFAFLDEDFRRRADIDEIVNTLETIKAGS